MWYVDIRRVPVSVEIGPAQRIAASEILESAATKFQVKLKETRLNQQM